MLKKLNIMTIKLDRRFFMSRIEEEISLLDGMVEDEKYIKARKQDRKYLLAEKQNAYNKFKGSLDSIKNKAIATFLAGQLVFASAMLFALEYKDAKDEELRHAPNHHYFSIRTGDDNSNIFFKYGTSSDIDKIRIIMKNTSTGVYINEFSKYYGVDPNIISAIMNYEGILTDNIKRDVVEHKVDIFSYNMKVIYQILNNNFPNISSKKLKSALLLCSIESEHIGLNNVIKAIDNYILFNYDGEFNYIELRKYIDNMKLDEMNNNDNQYVEKIIAAIPSPSLKCVVEGEEINWSLENDINNLNIDDYKVL